MTGLERTDDVSVSTPTLCQLQPRFHDDSFKSRYFPLVNFDPTVNMNVARVFTRRIARRQSTASLPPRWISSTRSRLAEENPRVHSNADEYRKYQKEKTENPHMTNTNSTIHNDMPSLGEDKPPPEMISAVDPNYVPKDKHSENTERMTGGTQPGDPDKVSHSDYAVGEMEGISFRVEPLRRAGEDLPTMRARLLCWCTP